MHVDDFGWTTEAGLLVSAEREPLGYFVSRTNVIGEQVWETLVGVGGVCRPRALVIDGCGGAYIACSYAPADPVDETRTGGVTARVTDEGEVEWTRLFEPAGGDPRSASVDTNDCGDVDYSNAIRLFTYLFMTPPEDIQVSCYCDLQPIESPVNREEYSACF